jgi:hypothetical protein
MLAQQRVEEIVAALFEDASDALLDPQHRDTLVALAEYVVRFASPEELAHRIVEEEAENHGVPSEELRPRGRARRDVTRARYAVVRRLGALGLSTRRIAGLLGYSHHGPIALILKHKREWRR